MALRHVGVDDKSGENGSPTVWLDEEKREFVIQGWDPGADLLAQVEATPPPNHAPGVPPGESIIRLPFRMGAIIRKAVDDAEQL
jgi:hypothetical protein